MIKKNKVAGLLFLVVSALCSDTYVVAGHKSDIDTFIGGACIAAAGLLGVAGIAKLAHWCFSESDEQVITRVYGEYNQGLSYNDMMYYMQQTVYDSESVLYNLAVQIWQTGQQNSSYRSQLYSLKNKLQASLSTLYKRIMSLQSAPRLTYDEKRAIAQMRSLAEKIEQLLPHLIALSDYFDSHKTYFDLYEVEAQLMHRYNEQISLLSNGGHWSHMEHNIKQSVIYADSGRYPFVYFVDRLESDIAWLKKTVSRTAYQYVGRIGCARELLDNLIHVKNMIVADTRYAQERQAIELERIERERLAAFQAQVRAQQNMANALYQQNLLLALQKNDPHHNAIVVNVNV
jgi:hypothetical protein